MTVLIRCDECNTEAVSGGQGQELIATNHQRPGFAEERHFCSPGCLVKWWAKTLNWKVFTQ